MDAQMEVSIKVKINPTLRNKANILAFIHSYTKTHRRAPSELEMQNYFKVSPPSVHQMVLTLTESQVHGSS